MGFINQYSILETLHQGGKSAVFRASREDGGGFFVLKRLHREYPLAEDLAQFDREFEIGRHLECDGVPRVLERFYDGPSPVIVFEQAPGRCLRETVREPLPLLDFLQLAVRLCEILAEVHRRKVIHKDISPGNVLWHPATAQVHLIDFGLATRLPRQSMEAASPEALEGTLAYISPEQTGRINRALDSRSDLYSLGVLFYQLLTASLPFDSQDPAQLVYSHISRRPEPPRQRRPGLPEALSAMVMKLLEKSAEDRYQSASGLRHDLEHCRDSLLRTGEIEPFPLGLRDIPERFQIPDKLYGREQELAELKQAYAQLGNGFFDLMLVVGEAGTGKTSLVEELRLPVLRDRGFFLAGNFDPLRRDRPYFGLIQAVESFVRQMLAEPEERTLAWKTLVLQRLGENAGLLLELTPDLELLLGPQADPPPVCGEEAARRLHHCFQQFFLCLPCAEHPLVLFLDNLQWADSATLKLLSTLARTPEARHILILAACRDESDQDSPTLGATLDAVRRHQGALKTLRLGPLPPESLVQLLSDTLKSPREAVRALAEASLDKTRGNPFFLRQFLGILHEEGLIGFDRSKEAWHWDIKGIAAAEVTENVIDLMLYRAARLSASSRSTLQEAACFGGRFSLSLLAGLLRQPEGQVLKDLQEPLHGELITLSRGASPQTQGLAVFQFAHDRIQQACYALGSEPLRSQTHLRIARLLGQSLSAAQLEDGIFELVNQYNLGKAHITDPTERNELCRLNLRAGLLAKQSSAFDIALDYFLQAMELLPADSWQTLYEPTLALHCQGAETAYLCGQTQRMQTLAARALEHCRSEMDRVPLQETLILSRLSANDSRGALDLALPLLERLGMSFASRPRLARVMFAYARTRLALLGRSPEPLSSAPSMKEPRMLAAMRIASSILSAAYISSPNLYLMIVLRQVRLSLALGNAPQSAFAYANFGLILCGLIGDIPLGCAFGRTARELADKPEARDQKARVCFIVNALIRHHNEHFSDIAEDLAQTRQTGTDMGDFEFGTYAGAVEGYHGYLSGTPLRELARTIERNAGTSRRLNQRISCDYQSVFLQAIAHLQAEQPPEELFRDEIFNRNQALGQTQTCINGHLGACLHLLEMQISLLLGRREDALRAAESLRPLLDSILGFALYPEFHFLDALLILDRLPELRGWERMRQRRRLGKIAGKLRSWARHCPGNYRARYLIVRGEMCRVRGQDRKAVVFYDLALERARESGQIHIQALACRLIARFWQNLEKRELAAYYINLAGYWFEKWGARALVNHLQKEYAHLFLALEVPMTALATETHSSSSASQVIDYAAVLKASQVLSQEIVLENLLERLMEIVMENAGADRAFFILENDGQLHVEAEAGYEPGPPRVGGHLPVRQEVRLPHSILNYALRTGEPLMVEDAARQGPFVGDPRVQADRLRSVFCMPLQHKGRRLGALYLENSLTAGAFTPKRIELLRLLSSEMVISIENAKLYKHLEQTNQELENQVSERTDALRQTNMELRQKNEKIDSLLLNILPRRIVQNLKETGRAAPEHFEHVAVFFSDIINFTSKVSEFSPQLVIDELNDLFTNFDRIMAQHGCERIKTIGDGYLAVCGIPDPRPQCAAHLITAGLDILDYLRERNRARRLRWEVRIGIHCGSVVGGVIGEGKFIYDVFGDTINTAARIERHSEPMQINVSEPVVACLKGRFLMRYRDELALKGKGPMRLYFVERRLDAAEQAPEASPCGQTGPDACPD